MILWLVEMGNIHFVCNDHNREGAKRKAHAWMGGDPDKYIVTPLTEKGDRYHVAVTVYV